MARPDRKKDIMKAAERLFASRRFHEVTLDEVAKASRVGKGTIYRHFSDKDDLFFQTATSGFDDLCELLVREVPGEGPFRQRLLCACLRVRGFFNSRRPLFRLMQAEASRVMGRKGTLRERWLSRRTKLVSALGDILRQGAREGLIRKDVSAEVLATLLLGMLRTSARELSDAPEMEGSVELALDVFLSGAETRPAAKRHRRKAAVAAADARTDIQ